MHKIWLTIGIEPTVQISIGSAPGWKHRVSYIKYKISVHSSELIVYQYKHDEEHFKQNHISKLNKYKKKH